MRAAVRRAILAAVLAVPTLVGAPVVPGVPGVLGAAPANAATPDLTLVTAARYEVRPDEARVAVTVDITATNHLRDTVIRRYFFERAFLAVMPGTTKFRISSEGAKPTVRVAAKRKTHTLLRIDFGRRIYSGRSAALQLRFDLPDRGGSPSRQLRIGSTLTSFPVWAFASESTPGSTVTVVFPEGFAVRVEAGELDGPDVGEGGTVVLRSGRLQAPLKFSGYVLGEREGAYAERRLTSEVARQEVEIAVRSWQDDPRWGERVGDLFVRGMPELGRRIGLPYSGNQPLVVAEAVSRSTGGYAGLYDPDAGRIEVAYYADSFVVLHEAAHAWFNGRLLGDRWLNEAFASWYALRAAETLEVKATGDALTDELRAARIPLNAWGGSGAGAGDGAGAGAGAGDGDRDEAGDRLADDYAYAAALRLAGLIAERAGEDGLRRAWATAADRSSAYGASERLDHPPDWRGVLDLLEATTGETFDDLWRTWVVRPDETRLLDDRRDTRADLRATELRAGDWQLPRVIARAMTAWQFEQARGLLTEARSILALRDAIRDQAAAAGLALPSTLRDAFEGTGGMAVATFEAEAELAAIAAIASAIAAGADPQREQPIEQLGLLGQEPDRDLTTARDAFAAGDLSAAVGHAEAARAVWLGAGELGRDRLIGVLAAILAIIAVILIVTSRRRPRSRRMAHRVATVR